MKTVVKFLAVATVAFVSGVVFGQFQKGKTIGNSIIDGVEDARKRFKTVAKTDEEKDNK